MKKVNCGGGCNEKGNYTLLLVPFLLLGFLLWLLMFRFLFVMSVFVSFVLFLLFLDSCLPLPIMSFLRLNHI